MRRLHDLILEVVHEALACNDRSLVNRPQLWCDASHGVSGSNSEERKISGGHASEDERLWLHLIHLVHDVVDGVSIVVD